MISAHLKIMYKATAGAEICPCGFCFDVIGEAELFEFYRVDLGCTNCGNQDSRFFDIDPVDRV